MDTLQYLLANLSWKIVLVNHKHYEQSCQKLNYLAPQEYTFPLMSTATVWPSPPAT